MLWLNGQCFGSHLRLLCGFQPHRNVALSELTESHKWVNGLGADIGPEGNIPVTNNVLRNDSTAQHVWQLRPFRSPNRDGQVNFVRFGQA